MLLVPCQQQCAGRTRFQAWNRLKRTYFRWGGKVALCSGGLLALAGANGLQQSFLDQSVQFLDGLLGSFNQLRSVPLPGMVVFFAFLRGHYVGRLIE